jgi:hypothetical protein
MRFGDETRKPGRSQGCGKSYCPRNTRKDAKKNLCPRMTLMVANENPESLPFPNIRPSRGQNNFRVFRGLIFPGISYVAGKNFFLCELGELRVKNSLTQSSRSSQSKTINPPNASPVSNNSANNPRPLLRAASSRFCNRLPGYASGRPGCDIVTGRGDVRAYR